MRAVVKDDCSGCGLCVDSAPEVFEMDGSVAKVKMDPIPDNLAESAREAAAGCPSESIVIS
jgi:ferredoxin